MVKGLMCSHWMVREIQGHRRAGCTSNNTMRPAQARVHLEASIRYRKLSRGEPPDGERLISSLDRGDNHNGILGSLVLPEECPPVPTCDAVSGSGRAWGGGRGKSCLSLRIPAHDQEGYLIMGCVTSWFHVWVYDAPIEPKFVDFHGTSPFGRSP